MPLDHPRDADSSYTISKTAAQRYVEISGLDYVSFRMATVYGPRMAGGPLVIFYKRLSEGKPVRVVDARRDFTYVDDVVDLVMMALDGTGHGAYNVGSGRDRPIRDLYETVRLRDGRRPPGDVELAATAGRRPTDPAAGSVADDRGLRLAPHDSARGGRAAGGELVPRERDGGRALHPPPRESPSS